MPIDHAHLRAQWPAGLAVQLRSSGGLPVLHPVKKDGVASVDLSLDGVKPIPAPKGAPPRFQYGRLVEITDFASWSGVAGLMGPLFVKASTLPPQGVLQGEIARIKALSPDPKVRAEAALALVQDRVRYVLLAINDGGLIPADAETTWSRRFGDCKGKTTLLLALLHGLGIQADPVTVSSQIGDGMDQRLPLIELFDHVLVRAEIGGRTYWLDGTRSGDRHLDAIRVPPFRWALPLVARHDETGRAGAAAVRRAAGRRHDAHRCERRDLAARARAWRAAGARRRSDRRQSFAGGHGARCPRPGAARILEGPL